MRLVRNAAQSLPVQRRDEFLQRLAAQLTSQPSDAAVQAAVTAPQQRRRTPMKRHYRPRDDDDDIVPDGGRVRVPLTMMDSVQRAVTVAGAPVRDGQGGTAGLHRPGVRLAVGDARARKTVVRDPRGRLLETREEEEFEADDAAMDARDAAYAAYDRRIAREYLNPGFDPSITGQRAGDLCTINGTPGHLRMVNGALQCVPDRSADAAPVEGDDGCPECEGTGSTHTARNVRPVLAPATNRAPKRSPTTLRPVTNPRVGSITVSSVSLTSREWRACTMPTTPSCAPGTKANEQ